jgi:hypothetical protein
MSTQTKVKTLAQVVEEFYIDGEREIPHFRKRLQAALERWEGLKKNPEMKLPEGLNPTSISDLAVIVENKKIEITNPIAFLASAISFNYGVQRDLRTLHVLKIMENFDPRVVRPIASALRNGIYYIFDGQHTAVALAVLGFLEIPLTWVETANPSFDALAFEILNDTGILRAGTEEIHRGLLYRWNQDELGTGDRQEPRVKTAYQVDTLFKECKIDLEPKRVRKSPGKKGHNDHYFSHFDYAYKGLDMTGDIEQLRKILLAIKKYYPQEDGGEINQGIYIGLVKMYALAREDGSTKFLPTDWIDKILSALITVCGKSAEGIHSAAKKQWQYKRGTSWDAPVAMSSLMREVYVVCNPADRTFNPPHEPKVNVGIMDGDICSEFKPYFKKAA